MKLKIKPDDFQVEELTEVVPQSDGSFAFYRLEKRGWSTPDALDAVHRRWGIDWRRINCGGLKDRHAHTIQFLSILHGPRRRLRHQHISLTYLGQLDVPFSSKDIKANRFRITLRSLTEPEVDRGRQAVEDVRQFGVPNYFDDQRFGSVAPGGEFVAKLMVLGQFEDALKLALTAPYEHDRAPQKREKAALIENWGRWAECRNKLRRGPACRPIDYLIDNPDDFRGAVQRLRPELQGLYLFAYQSHLWNRLLATWLNNHLRQDQLLFVPTRLGPLPMPIHLEPGQLATLAGLHVPLPSARTQIGPDSAWAVMLKDVLAPEGLRLEDLKIKGMRKPFFARGDRAALCEPKDLRVDVAGDDLHPGQSKMVLSFDLPRGSYATLIVKRVTLPRRRAD